MNWLKQYFNHKDRVGSLILFTFAVAFFYMSISIEVVDAASQSFTARTLPLVLSSLLVVCSIIHFIQSSRISFDNNIRQWRWRQAAALILLMAIYATSFSLLGFFLASVLFLVTGFRILGEKSYKRSGLIAIVLVGSIWLLLTKVFGLFLEQGEWPLLMFTLLGK